MPRTATNLPTSRMEPSRRPMGRRRTATRPAKRTETRRPARHNPTGTSSSQRRQGLVIVRGTRRPDPGCAAPSPRLKGGIVMRQVDLLEPVDVTERLPQLELYLSQVCAVAGISKMQLD